jgi:hypothetical protein
MDQLGLIASGLKACGDGVRVAFKQPAFYTTCLPHTLITLTVSLGFALSLWIPCQLFRIVGLEIRLESVLLPTSILVLKVQQQLMPALSNRSFFLICLSAAADEASVDDVKQIETRPILRGLISQLRFLVVEIVLGISAVMFAIGSATLWIPVAAASYVAVGGMLVLISPLAWIAFIIALILALLAAKSLQPIVQMLGFVVGAAQEWGLRSPLFAFAALLFLVFWVMGQHGLMVQFALTYSLSVHFSKQLLTQYSMRLTSTEWETWCTANGRPWILAGFGLPISAAIRLGHPLVGIALLELLQGSAAVLVVAEEKRTAASGTSMASDLASKSV